MLTAARKLCKQLLAVRAKIAWCSNRQPDVPAIMNVSNEEKATHGLVGRMYHRVLI
jgi:hypothetical protein